MQDAVHALGMTLGYSNTGLLYPTLSSVLHCVLQSPEQKGGQESELARVGLAAQVPRSSKLIYEDNDYSLFSVTLFKRVADSFKAAARSKGFQVRHNSSGRQL